MIRSSCLFIRKIECYLFYLEQPTNMQEIESNNSHIVVVHPQVGGGEEKPLCKKETI